MKKSGDEIDFLNDYKSEFVSIFIDDFKKDVYKSSH